MASVGDELLKYFDTETLSGSFAMSDGKIKPSSLASSISISTVTDTSAIKIVVTTKNAELSARVCNELCKQANYFTDKAIGVGEIKSIDTAKVYPNPVGPISVSVHISFHLLTISGGKMCFSTAYLGWDIGNALSAESITLGITISLGMTVLTENLYRIRKRMRFA